MFRLILFFLISSSPGFSQDTGVDSYTQHTELAQEYNLAYRFDESIAELEKAMEIALIEKNEYRTLQVEISMAELMRRTQRYERGYDILNKQSGFEKYPDLHVRRLGRLAAIYSEGRLFEHLSEDQFNTIDSIRTILTEALEIAVKNQFYEQEASLQNELGLFTMRNDDRLSSIPHFKRSAELYWEMGDSTNYMRPMIYLMENDLIFGNLEQFDQTAKELLVLSNGKGWWMPEADLFKMIGNRDAMLGDSLSYYKWRLKANNNHFEYQKEISSDRMISYEVLYETEKFQKEAMEADLKTLRKSEELDRETTKNRNLYFLLSILLFVLIGGGIFYIQDRKLRKKLKRSNDDLNISNDRYQLLMVESNHRIKNNLQMVTSMVQYFGEELSPEEQKLSNNIKGKIYTISSLHKRLTMGVHNELVDLGGYFDDILNLYVDLNNDFEVKKKYSPIKIRSERIIYFGLILNELISNTIEHHNGDNKEIHLVISAKADEYILSYCDHSLLDHTAKVGLGSKLLDKLIKRVGGKKIIIDKSIGLYKFSFHV